MKSRSDFKSQIISTQKPRKRRGKSGRTGSSRDRSRIDLMELHKNLTEARSRRRPTKYTWIRGLFSALIATAGFFLLGYLIAALSVSMWAKILLFGLITVLGIISSYIVAALFH